MIVPTQRAVLVFAVGIPPALLFAIEEPQLWVMSFDYAALVLLAIAADALFGAGLRGMTIDVETPATMQIGEKGGIAALLAAPRQRRATRVELIGEIQGELEPPQIVAGTIVPGKPCRVDLAVMARRRGRLTVDRVDVRWRGPMGLVSFTRRLSVGRTIDVLPNVHGVRGAALQFFAREAIYGIKVQQQKGEGAEFDALRDYAPGLDNRFIDWKHSARHRKLLCKEFRTERNNQIVLAFDTGRLMLEPIDGMPRLDHAINAALLLAWISLQSGDLVGIYGFDAHVRHYRAPVRGIAGFARLLRATSELDYHLEETNFTLGLASLTARLTRRALVILFTDFVDTVTAELLIESMGRIANRHVVVFVTLRDPFLQAIVDAAPDRFADVAKAVIAHDFQRDRSIVLERLDRLGVHCLDLPSRSLPVGLLNRYLMIKQRGLI
jgi:uncharacterized protein (DUF58 family)